jgi:hypothetical protein
MNSHLARSHPSRRSLRELLRMRTFAMNLTLRSGPQGRVSKGGTQIRA